ncbi:hypothetical protein COCNU_scaffold036828G000020 [Cocos nucifera]|nr:hypothetical protein [Cocos nucifera]
MEFLSRSASGDGPLVAFGGSDGVIRVLSMLTWKLVRRYTGGHKGSISCLMTFMASTGLNDVMLLSKPSYHGIRYQVDHLLQSVSCCANHKLGRFALSVKWGPNYLVPVLNGLNHLELKVQPSEGLIYPCPSIIKGGSA